MLCLNEFQALDVEKWAILEAEDVLIHMHALSEGFKVGKYENYVEKCLSQSNFNWWWNECSGGVNF